MTAPTRHSCAKPKLSLAAISSHEARFAAPTKPAHQREARFASRPYLRPENPGQATFVRASCIIINANDVDAARRPTLTLLREERP